jgi:transcriptional regulator with XRE-family HTH domain
MIMSLDKRRREAKLSRRKWLAKAGVAESTYYNWLREIYTPRVVTLERLRQAIDGPIK